MSKEYLEALERLKTAPSFMGGTAEYQFCTKSETLLMQDYETVKQVLKRLESIDNADSSEALECLEALEQDIKDRTILAEDRQLKLCAIIKRALIKAQKEHEILETIKEKSSNSGLCIDYLKTNKYYPNMQDYKHYCMTIREFYRVNEETFNILKEWILNA